eukprot:gb/GEZN01000779.1/.p1 GENE.gb/GEZN01000779.1/~~gb/GEZN01000779.1/.p1  ORF type:complete len:995 (-),score=171.85 gb/GEZN01000779.1/:726-3335(-)
MSGEWRGVTAGGNLHVPTWRTNPQYRISLSRPSELVLSLSQSELRSPTIVRDEGQNQATIGFCLAKTTNRRLRKCTLNATSIICKTLYKKQHEVWARARVNPEIDGKDLIFIPSTFAPGEEASYRFCVWSDVPLVITELTESWTNLRVETSWEQIRAGFSFQLKVTCTEEQLRQARQRGQQHRNSASWAPELDGKAPIREMELQKQTRLANQQVGTLGIKHVVCVAISQDPLQEAPKTIKSKTKISISDSIGEEDESVSASSDTPPPHPSIAHLTLVSPEAGAAPYWPSPHKEIVPRSYEMSSDRALSTSSKQHSSKDVLMIEGVELLPLGFAVFRHSGSSGMWAAPTPAVPVWGQGASFSSVHSSSEHSGKVSRRRKAKERLEMLEPGQDAGVVDALGQRRILVYRSAVAHTRELSTKLYLHSNPNGSTAYYSILALTGPQVFTGPFVLNVHVDPTTCGECSLELVKEEVSSGPSLSRLLLDTLRPNSSGTMLSDASESAESDSEPYSNDTTPLTLSPMSSPLPSRKHSDSMRSKRRLRAHSDGRLDVPQPASDVRVFDNTRATQVASPTDLDAADMTTTTTTTTTATTITTTTSTTIISTTSSTSLSIPNGSSNGTLLVVAPRSRSPPSALKGGSGSRGRLTGPDGTRQNLWHSAEGNLHHSASFSSPGVRQKPVRVRFDLSANLEYEPPAHLAPRMPYSASHGHLSYMLTSSNGNVPLQSPGNPWRAPAGGGKPAKSNSGRSRKGSVSSREDSALLASFGLFFGDREEETDGEEASYEHHPTPTPSSQMQAQGNDSTPHPDVSVTSDIARHLSQSVGMEDLASGVMRAVGVVSALGLLWLMASPDAAAEQGRIRFRSMKRKLSRLL